MRAVRIGAATAPPVQGDDAAEGGRLPAFPDPVGVHVGQPTRARTPRLPLACLYESLAMEASRRCGRRTEHGFA